MGIGIAIQGNELKIRGATDKQFATIQRLCEMKWTRLNDEKGLVGPVNLTALDNLAQILREDGLSLPPSAEKRRRELHAVQDAVDRERVSEKPKPAVEYPVKLPLYAHQVRGANMALLTFGWVRPEGGKE